MKYSEFRRWLEAQGVEFSKAASGSHFKIRYKDRQTIFPFHGAKEISEGLRDAPINLSCSRGKLQFSRHLQRHWTKSDRKIMYGELFRPVL
ncbi:type II toxin-antitoxin system HicA family toxin, partial [Pseudomonas monteilii]|nr:type II toxin-antitoxin system HicA family toxin [Pseudomonas monteilii]